MFTVTVTWSGFGVELGEHVTRVVGQPLGGGAFRFRREGDRAAHLQDHVGHGHAKPLKQLVELGQTLGALAVEFAHMHVQHGGAGVVAVDRLLHLLVDRHRDVLGEVGRHPFGPVRGHCDHELVLVLGKERSIEEIHRLVLEGSAKGS